MYKIVFIGAGPANLSSILALKDKSNILLIEQGKSIYERPKTEVVKGEGGAGLFSDFKLSYGYNVGGSLLDHTDEEHFDEYVGKALDQYQTFTDKPLIWSEPSIHNIEGLDMITQRVIHVGTAEGFNIIRRIHEYLQQQGVPMMYDTEVVNISRVDDNTLVVVTSDGQEILTENIVIGTGQKDKLATQYFSDLEAKYNKFQLGIRVEIPNEDNRFKDILAANYDFKYFKRYETENFNVRIRTFCCNSGNAHVATEYANGLTSYNGHAIGDGQNNGLVNFGVICEMSPKNDLFGQEEFISQIAALNQSMNQNPYSFKEGFKQVFIGIPEIDACITDFLTLFDKNCKLSDGHFYTPEYKNTSPSYDYHGTFNELEKDIYLNGDIFCTRGIITSSACGIMTSDILTKKLDKAKTLPYKMVRSK